MSPITLHVNGQSHQLMVDPDTPLLYVLRHELGLKGPKYGCGSEQCGACKVLVDGQAVPSCKLPVRQVQSLPIVTVEGLAPAGTLHPLQEAFIAEQAIQCGYCAAGMIIAAQGLLNRVRYPSDDEIRAALADNLCRCGVYDRVRRAIRLRIGRPAAGPVYEILPAGTADPAGPPAIPLPAILQQNPALDDWVRINQDQTITLFSGKVELGQGLRTAIAQIGAEELDVALARVRVVTADTAQTPDEGNTVGSMSLETSGSAIRYAAAAARHQLLLVAYEELEAPLARLVVEDGTIRDPLTGRSVTYWALFGGRKFGVPVTGRVPPKLPASHTIVGQPATRLDLPAKVSGTPSFVHDLHLPGMVYGRVVRPPHPYARLAAVDSTAVQQMPGVLRVVQDGSFLGVIAEQEIQAIHAQAALQAAAVWHGDFPLTTPASLYETIFDQPGRDALIVAGTASDAPIPPRPTPPANAQTLAATYGRPYQMHASLGPSAAVAQMAGGRLTLWLPSQGVFPQQASIAHALGMDPADLHVIQVEGAGCYGHNGADDAAFDAALLARACPGRAVSVQWTRADEHGWEPYAPAMRLRLQASLDPAGQVIDWQHDVYSLPHFGRSRPGDGSSGLLAAAHLAQPLAPMPIPAPRGTHSAGFRNADPLYNFPQRRIVHHHLPHSPLRTSSMRGLGALANVFAIESFMDELAAAAGADPVDFRLRHLADPRARAVLTVAANKAGWQPGQQQSAPGRGWGIAFAQYKNRQTYTAVAVELQVAPASGEIQLLRAVIAADAGQIINPDGLSNQLEGGFVQAASLALYEQVTWGAQGITSLDWESYPILRFPNAPVIETVLLSRPGLPHVGAGEAAAGPTAAAIANAIFAAVGVRRRQMPLNPVVIDPAGG